MRENDSKGDSGDRIEERSDENVHQQLQIVLREILGKSATFAEIGDAVHLEADELTLIFADDGDDLKIKNITVREEGGGLGTYVIGALMDYAESHNMGLVASNVQDSARSFWESIGFLESAESGEYYIA